MGEDKDCTGLTQPGPLQRPQKDNARPVWCPGRPRGSCLRMALDDTCSSLKNRDGRTRRERAANSTSWSQRHRIAWAGTLEVPGNRHAQSSQEQEPGRGSHRDPLKCRHKNLEHQSFLCCLLAPGVLHSTRVTLRKLQMERHDKNNCLGSRIQKLRKNRMYVAKATLILCLYAYELRYCLQLGEHTLPRLASRTAPEEGKTRWQEHVVTACDSYNSCYHTNM